MVSINSEGTGKVKNKAPCQKFWNIPLKSKSSNILQNNQVYVHFYSFVSLKYLSLLHFEIFWRTWLHIDQDLS